MSAMTPERRVSLIVDASQVSRLATGLAMDTARYAEAMSNVQKESALRGIRMIRQELDGLEREILGLPERIEPPPRAA